MFSTMAERIKQRRKIIGITQQELADKIGFSVITVKRWEDTDAKKGRIPNASVVPKIAEALDTTIEYLMGSEEEKKADISFNQTRTEQPERIIYNYGNHHFDLPATPEGYKAFNEALSAMIHMNNTVAVAAN